MTRVLITKISVTVNHVAAMTLTFFFFAETVVFNYKLFRRTL